MGEAARRIRGIDIYPDNWRVQEAVRLVGEKNLVHPVRNPPVHRAAVFLVSLVFVSKLDNGTIQREAGWDPWTVRQYMRQARSAGILGQQVGRDPDGMDRFPDEWHRNDGSGNLAVALDAMVVAGAANRTKDGRYSLTESRHEPTDRERGETDG